MAASEVIKVILNNSNTLGINTFYNFNLIETDPAGNKFVDCAIAANAEFIVTEDRHYDVLKNILFPKVNIIALENFMKTL